MEVSYFNANQRLSRPTVWFQFYPMRYLQLAQKFELLKILEKCYWATENTWKMLPILLFIYFLQTNKVTKFKRTI